MADLEGFKEARDIKAATGVVAPVVFTLRAVHI